MTTLNGRRRKSRRTTLNGRRRRKSRRRKRRKTSLLLRRRSRRSRRRDRRKMSHVRKEYSHMIFRWPSSAILPDQDISGFVMVEDMTRRISTDVHPL